MRAATTAPAGPPPTTATSTCSAAHAMVDVAAPCGDGVPLADGAPERSDRLESGSPQQVRHLAGTVRTAHRQRGVVSRVPVASEEMADEPGTEPAEPLAVEVVDDDAGARHAAHLGHERDRFVGCQVVDHE